MKKKFVLITALVLLVAVGLSAATPVELSGEFNASRKFTFDPTTITPASNLKLNALSVSGDFWKISISSGGLLFDDKTNNASAEIYLDKALAAQGVDMGDVTLTLGVGNKATSGLMHVYYDDPTKEVKMLGVAAKGTTELTVGYTQMVTAKAALNFDVTNKPMAISSTFAPIDGVKVAAGFTNYSEEVAAVVAPPVAQVISSALAVSASVDVAALAGIEDFGLSAYVYDGYYIESEKNYLDVALKASYADIGVTVAMDTNNRTDKTNMFVKGSYSGIENVGLNAKLILTDLSDIKLGVEADASYKMGGVTYKLATAYSKADKFSLTPSVQIKF